MVNTFSEILSLGSELFCRLVVSAHGALEACRIWDKVRLCGLPSQDSLVLLWGCLWMEGVQY